MSLLSSIFRNNKKTEKKIKEQSQNKNFEVLKYDGVKNGADCYSKNGDAVTVLTWQS